MYMICSVTILQNDFSTKTHDIVCQPQECCLEFSVKFYFSRKPELDRVFRFTDHSNTDFFYCCGKIRPTTLLRYGSE